MQIDPRTVAREIPGVLNQVFPQLTPGIVAHFNASATGFLIREVPRDLLSESKLQRAMLFELAYIVGEQLVGGAEKIDWNGCFQEAVRCQRKYYDARLPDSLEQPDQTLAEIVGSNLASALRQLSEGRSREMTCKPRIPGLEWIASGCGDFALGPTLIEVKCTSKRFSAADYRQVAIYWLLSYAEAVEGRGVEWQDFVLLNPRSGQLVTMSFDAFLGVTSGGQTKVDILQRFRSLVGSRLM